MSKTLADRLPSWLRPAVYLGNNGITLTGAVVTTSAAITTIGFWMMEAWSREPLHPYAGIIGFLILPGIFVGGLVLMPAGALLRRHQLTKAGQLPTIYPRIDFAEPMLRRAGLLVAGMTVINVAILGIASVRGIEFMDSQHFCGETCHSVMAPEYTAYKDSPHSRVECVGCHIGPGASWFVKSKLSGTRQLFAVAFNTFNRPIPSPVKHLRPARETCEQCHWPQKFHGDKFIVRTKFSDDEKNTPLTTVLVLKVGGQRWNGSSGIHGRHLDNTEEINYVATDGRRQVIPVVKWKGADGKEVEYVSKDAKVTPAEIAKGEHRTMDCMDCHNRPTHAYQMPERAVDEAMSQGKISPELPWIKKKAVEALRVEYPDRDTAKEKIGTALTDFYKTQYPDLYKSRRAVIENAVLTVQGVYLRNVWPEMKILWGVYPNNLGHEDFLGCFRCHDDNHVSKDGKTISQSCDTCHNLLAQDESDPKILAELGLK